jgi:AcrR family transcriptional regulator
MTPSASMSEPPVSAKRAGLLDAAWRLFYRDGYHAVGIDTVLAEAGVAKMTLYKHFPSKEDLIGAVLERRSRELEIVFEKTLAEAGRSGTKRLLALFAMLGAWFRMRDFNGCAFIKAVAEYPDPKSKPHRAAAAHKTRLLTRVTTLAEELGAKDPEALARSLMLLSEGAIVTAHIYDRPEAAEEAAEAARVLITTAAKQKDAV